ncbi:MAG: hypothetical protein QOG65_1078, partial [Actinomycetota bacterium]|nr:hypothetical protein [Actinomycetota bacterium]
SGQPEDTAAHRARCADDNDTNGRVRRDKAIKTSEVREASARMLPDGRLLRAPNTLLRTLAWLALRGITRRLAEEPLTEVEAWTFSS